MSPRRVVITGIGVVSPLGCTTKQSFKNLIEGKCGISQLLENEYSKLPCKLAGRISKDDLNVENYFSKSELRTMAPSTTYAMIAAKEALTNADWFPKNKTDMDRTGVAVGVGMVDLQDICETSKALEKGYNRVSPFFVPRILPNMASGHISIKYGFRGPNHSVSTACATGAHSIADAFRFIRYNNADVMVCGGAEACISPIAIAGFCRLRALSTSYNNNPLHSSRPFDRDREGFVMGEGSAILILEELDHAKERKANIIAEILGVGYSGDASHLTAPSEDGTGAYLAMERALADSNIMPNDISYINAHATSTPIGDAIEVKAIKSLFQKNCKDLLIGSTKGAHGHLLGAAGNLEAAFTALSCQAGILPPSLNIENISDDMTMNYITNLNKKWNPKKRRIALKNAFGFGGTNASLCFGEYA